ncbi:flagellar motor switch protein FliG [Pseudoruegeria sp. SK021]|uniref:flagellar motor switch protein FliG n=1 Tax=Pseudoruegeria sp. SK021 TaxID=1933035 RepID=UPI000A25D59A|nr:FliG C-terminal domain-containing protein [Pseudoruegeria sp. SK021]OSP56270.1 flagellar motor switch protein FliG [Pseudoruegeria sp. SK021]
MSQALAHIGGSLARPAAPLPARRPRPRLSQRQKAAIIVRLLLKEGTQLSLEDLPESLQVDLTHEMGALRRIDKDTLREVVEEFTSEVNDLGMSFPGGLEDALTALDGAISSTSIRRVRQETGLVMTGDPWRMISGLSNQILADIIRQESTEIAAVVLSKLPVARSAEMLGQLPGDLARRITYAISTTSSIDPDTVRMIGLGIASQVADTNPRAFPEAPVDRLGAILNFSAAATRDDVLTGLDQADAGFAQEVRKAIFTFANIHDRIFARDIPKVTRAVDQTLLVTALAAAADAEADIASAEFMFTNMSQRLASQLREEIADLGKVKSKDGEEAMNAVVAAIRDMERAGELTLRTDDDD